MKQLSLSKDFQIPAIDYAGQGNAILGIRDSGKSYTAMKAAEQLLDAGIPIICYDPVGIWKNLKIGTGKNKGYPIVTAGGPEADIHLTASNAVDIVRAAMKAGVSLVIDLYSPELINKSTWIRIVQETVDMLMYENEKFGMRHIFIEEAAEFIPQRLQPQHSKVYASIERLARMGRNARLGYTLINQRAEEVNKAILEISALSFLHKQVGKNSLLSITKWLDLLQVDNSKEIIQRLPQLKQGECWIVGTGDQPKLIQVAAKKTFHPDPKRSADVKQDPRKATDVSSFVEKLNKQLKKPEPPVAKPIASKTAVFDKSIPVANTKELEKQILLQSKMLEVQHKHIDLLLAYHSKTAALAMDIFTNVKALHDFYSSSIVEKELNAISKRVFPAGLVVTSDKYTSSTVTNTSKALTSNPGGRQNEQLKSMSHKPINSSGTLPIGEKAILIACAQFPNGLERSQLTVLTGYKRSSRDTYIQRLKEKQLLMQSGDRLVPTLAGTNELGPDFEPLPTGQALQDYWLNKLPLGEATILKVLIANHPEAVDRDSITRATDYKRSSRDTYIQRMSSKEIIVIVDRGMVKASDTLFD